MTPTDRLKMLMNNEQFVHIANQAFWSLRRFNLSPAAVLSNTADNLCSLFGLSGEVHENAIMLWGRSSRAKHPACIIVSMQQGQSPSPSAAAYRRGAYALIQTFEGDADDTDVAGDCPAATHRIETKGRVLLH